VIGRERLRVILAEHDVTFQKTKTWKESNDPLKDAKLDRIEEVTTKYPERCFAFDEFGPLAVHPVGGCCWSKASKPQRLRANYHKTCGVRQFHGCYSYADDTIWGVVRERKSVKNSLAAIRSCRAARQFVDALRGEAVMRRVDVKPAAPAPSGTSEAASRGSRPSGGSRASSRSRRR